jgi:sortase A
MSRRVRLLSTLLIVAGVLMLADVAVTLAWQEPVTALIALVKRGNIDKRYLSYDSMPLSAAQRASLLAMANVDERVAYLARQDQREVPNGAAIGRLEIPRIGVSYEVVQGTDTSDLELGPAHYADTAFPGLGETVAIAGHRTTYLAPFRNLNLLVRGSRIVLQMPYASFDYVVTSQRVVQPNALWITRNVGYEQLVLSACNPLYSASQRIAVFARLVSTHPSKTALDKTWTSI